MRRAHALTAASIALLSLSPLQLASAAGTLRPVNASAPAMQIRQHHVKVVIENGFARTEVTQVFFNPSDTDQEAIYSFPVPISASLSEVTVAASELELHGEVVPRNQAEQVYQEEASQGREAGLATKNQYQTFEFRVSAVRAQAEARMAFVYYQPLNVDTGVGRYVYPLEDGGTDEAAASFWTRNEKVDGTFSFDVTLRSAAPIDEVRLPGLDQAAKVEKLDEGHYKVRLEAQDAPLNKDLVFYYRLRENLPGRVELIPYRADDSAAGTFMLVLTPGLDLKPLNAPGAPGSDYTFVLDTSGSMKDKLSTLASGVSQAIGSLRETDRYRVITFSNSAADLTGGYLPATRDNVARTLEAVARLAPQGSTNLYDGLNMALKQLDDDRATSVVLVTDGVTNTGVCDPAAFRDLAKKHDIRLFGFLMGNNSNWPLVRTVCEASGGFYAPVSNSDDIVGQIMLAKSKVTSECLHDAELSVSGVKVFDTTAMNLGKVYRGQQLVIFGRYEKGGRATVKLKARLTGEDKTYTTTFDFPDLETSCPEVERLWAMNRIEAVETMESVGDITHDKAVAAIQTLGVDYQLVTDHTAMLVVSDGAYERHGIQRRNKARTNVEHAAQSQRAAQPIAERRVDQQQPMFTAPAPTLGNGGSGSGSSGGGRRGGGAVGPLGAIAALALGGLVAAHRRRHHSR